VTRQPRGTRQDPREVAELRALAERQPELSAAALLQIELVSTLRRIQTRTATAPVVMPEHERARRLATGRHLVDFDSLAIDWSEVRLLFRQITDVLRRHDAVDARGAAALHEIGRSPSLPDLARRWFETGSGDAGVEMLDEVLAWALRPFLVRTADVLQQRGGAAPFGAWTRGLCPVCGGEPDFACITTSGERLLICGRCHTRWPTTPFACPFCGEADRQRITSFATPDGTYRVMACQTCKRYLKTFDSRRADRGVMPTVDTIATLPLDAVVMQKGFRNG
jgi:formate dehydrogenase maturation protein FdhE